MPNPIDRRTFMSSAALSTTMGLWARGASPNEKLVVCVAGMGGRGTRLATGFAKQPNTVVKYVCDPDRQRAGRAAQKVGKVADKSPRTLTDFREALEDEDVDVCAFATPDHWHAPGAILAASAGRHAYVEKPCSHNAREGELMVEASRKHNVAIQVGTQRRSWPKVREGLKKVREGEIGRVYYSRGWYANTRGSIGRGNPADPPDHIDYDLWQGPAPRTPFHDNYLHYNWHWFWRWGTGEIGNNGIHALDLCRAGLGVDYPVQVTSAGGRLCFNDDQETPDTNMATFLFEGEKMIGWEGLSCNRHGVERDGFGVTFHGSKGTVSIDGAGYTVYDPSDKKVGGDSGPGGDADHLADFLGAIREDKPRHLNAEIAEGHKSTLLCHLGNIAWRAGRTLACDPANGRIVDDEEAMRHWSREYESGWEPEV